jgi:hypothetical protein
VREPVVLQFIASQDCFDPLTSAAPWNGGFFPGSVWGLCACGGVTRGGPPPGTFPPFTAPANPERCHTSSAWTLGRHPWVSPVPQIYRGRGVFFPATLPLTPFWRPPASPRCLFTPHAIGLGRRPESLGPFNPRPFSVAGETLGIRRQRFSALLSLTRSTMLTSGTSREPRDPPSPATRALHYRRCLPGAFGGFGRTHRNHRHRPTPSVLRIYSRITFGGGGSCCR